jgi:F-box and leucine-rich repeat protein GRR1
LTELAGELEDPLLDGLELCSRVDRMTMTDSPKVSTQGLRKFVGGLKEVTAVEDTVVVTMAEKCERLQSLNLTGCKGVGDTGLKALAEHGKASRRVSWRLIMDDSSC